jgi:hypothetical protein
MVEEVAEIAAEQELLEAWILQEVQGGQPLTGLYPMNQENEERYRRSLQAR